MPCFIFQWHTLWQAPSGRVLFGLVWFGFLFVLIISSHLTSPSRNPQGVPVSSSSLGQLNCQGLWRILSSPGCPCILTQWNGRALPAPQRSIWHYASLNNRVEGRKGVRRHRNKLQKDNSNMKVYELWSLYFELELFFNLIKNVLVISYMSTTYIISSFPLLLCLPSQINELFLRYRYIHTYCDGYFWLSIWPHLELTKIQKWRAHLWGNFTLFKLGKSTSNLHIWGRKTCF